MAAKLIKDTRQKGLYKSVGATKNSWILKKRIKGGPVKSITLGDADLISPTVARQMALEYLLHMAKGEDPITYRNSQAAIDFTLKEALEKFLSQRRSNLKASTLSDYKRVIQRNLTSWLDRPLRSITRDEVIDAYHRIIEAVAKRGRITKAGVNKPGIAEADKTMRYLRGLFEFYVDDPLPDNSGLLLPYGNPVSALNKKRIRQPIKRRERFLELEERIKLRDFLTDPSHYFNQDGTPIAEIKKTKVQREHADWILILMLTGLRFREPLDLAWNDVDFTTEVFTVVENKSSRAFTLPMSPMVKRIFERRRRYSGEISQFVFPQAADPTKPATMSKVAERIREMSGVAFTIHDLRRTQATVLQSLGYELTDIARFLNHARLNQTDQYVQTDLERIREALTRVESLLFHVDTAEFEEE